MRTTILVFVLTGCLALVSCRRGAEQSGDEKITITVEHAKPPRDAGGKPELRREMKEAGIPPEPEKREHGEPRQGETNVAPPHHQPEIMELAEVRGILQRLVAEDERAARLIKNGDPVPLSGYLFTEHRGELQEIGRITGVKDEKKVAFLISHGLTRRQKASEGKWLFRPDRSDRNVR